MKELSNTSRPSSSAKARASVLRARNGSDASTPAAGSTPEFKATGTATSSEQQKAEHRRRANLVKQRTQCSACGRVGHWQGDSECPMARKGEGNSRESTGYFACFDDADGVADLFVMDTSVDDARLCQCCYNGDGNTGANGAARWLDFETCGKGLATASRKRTETGAACRRGSIP